MSYQALYRKYRPHNFSEVKGQDRIVTTLKNQLLSGRIGHAYLFCGTRGTGKTTVAKIFARAVNCERPTDEGPCGECATCKAIADGSAMNVTEIDAASNNSVADVRNLIDEVQYSPADGRYKVYIIDEVHMLSKSAFNALLKTLEEPPSYLIFILATTEVHALPLTILSRCQRYDFTRISVDTIKERLEELLQSEGIEAEDKALRFIARQADGALRDGLSLLEECVSYYFGQKITYDNVLTILGALDRSIYHELIKSLIEMHTDAVLATSEKVVSMGKDLAQFCTEFVGYLRDILIIKTADDPQALVDVSQESLAQMKSYADDIEEEQIFRYIRVMSELISDMRYETNKRVLFEMALIRLCRPQMERDDDSLIERIHALEEELSDLKERLREGEYAISSDKGELKDGEDTRQKPVQIRPEAVPEDVREVVANWKRIIAGMSVTDKTMLEDAYLSVDDGGSLIIAFQREVCEAYFAENDGARLEKLKEKISDTIGKNINIVTRLPESRKERDLLPDLQKLLKSVPVEVSD